MTRTFRYAARSKRGELVRGIVSATGPEDVVRMLRARALFVTDVRASADRWVFGGFAFLRPSSAAIVGFYRSLAVMTRSGVPLRRALAVSIERSSDARFTEILQSVLADIESGESLGGALEKRPIAFTTLAVALVRAGEIGGVLDVILERLATLAERDRTTRRRIRGLFAYPGFIVATALVVVGVVITRLLPAFEPLYTAQHVALPSVTVALLALGRHASDPASWAVTTLVLGACGATGAVALRRPDTRRALDAWRLRIPFVGPLVRKNIVARLARTLGTLLHSGVGVLQAIDILVPVAGSERYARMLVRLRADVSDGASLGTALRASGGFDALFCAMIAVGEETGAVDEMLLTLAGYLDDDVAFAIAGASAVLEPALLVILGLIIGVIVYAIFVPMYALIGGIT